MKNRYIFFKNLFPKYIIIFEKNNQRIVKGIDKELLKYQEFINYVIVKQNDSVIIKKREKNYYDFYYKKIILEKYIKEKLDN